MTKKPKRHNKRNKSTEDITKIYSEPQFVLFDQFLKEKQFKGKIKLKPLAKKFDLHHRLSEPRLSEPRKNLSYDFNHDSTFLTTNKDDLAVVNEKNSLRLSNEPKTSISFTLDYRSNNSSSKVKGILESKLISNQKGHANIKKSTSPVSDAHKFKPKNLTPLKRNPNSQIKLPKLDQSNSNVENSSTNGKSPKAKKTFSQTNSMTSEKRSQSIQYFTMKGANLNGGKIQKHLNTSLYQYITLSKSMKSNLKKVLAFDDDHLRHSPLLEKDVIKTLNKLDMVIQQSRNKFSQKQIGKERANDRGGTPKKNTKENIISGYYLKNNHNNNESPKTNDQDDQSHTIKNDSSIISFPLNTSSSCGTKLKLNNLSSSSRLKSEYNLNRERVLGKQYKPMHDSGEKNTLGYLGLKKNLMNKPNDN